jgi:hypothetical protein
MALTKSIRGIKSPNSGTLKKKNTQDAGKAELQKAMTDNT